MGRKVRRKVVGSRFGFEFAKRREKRTVAEFENLGFKVEWVDGKVIVTYKDGRTEVFNNFNELRVPSRTVKEKTNAKLPKDNAVYAERNGVHYYLYPELGLIVKNCLSYWDGETHPPENLFGKASEKEFEEALLHTIKSGKWTERAMAVAKAEIAWKEKVRKAIDRAILMLARKYNCEKYIIAMKDPRKAKIATLAEELESISGGVITVKFRA